MGKKAIPAGRRELVRNEVLFHGTGRALKHCQRHHSWIDVEIGRGETMVACGVCGRVKRGQTAPVWLEPKSA